MSVRLSTFRTCVVDFFRLCESTLIGLIFIDFHCVFMKHTTHEIMLLGLIFADSHHILTKQTATLIHAMQKEIFIVQVLRSAQTCLRLKK